MGKIIDLTGQRFGRLVIIERTENSKSGRTQWLCECDCGNEKIILSNSLMDGRTKSCGCIRSPDLTGQRFGKLVAIERVKKDKHNYYMYKCLCDCGNEKVIRSKSLSGGETKSCGCITQLIDLEGRRFGRLIVIKRAENKGTQTHWLCKCDCGNEKIVNGHSLKSGGTKSCGCLHKERTSKEYSIASQNRLYGRYKAGAKKRGYDFQISKDLFLELTKKNCFYCGAEPNHIIKNEFGTGDYLYNGIDRIDNDKGYEIDNVVACCEACNRAKLEMSKKEFLAWIEKVYNNSIKNNEKL